MVVSSAKENAQDVQSGAFVQELLIENVPNDATRNLNNMAPIATTSVTTGKNKRALFISILHISR